MSVRKRYGIVILFLLCCYLLLQFYPLSINEKEMKFVKNDMENPLVIAHGGAKKLYPENTILAFEKSIEMGVDAIEMDIRLSADNVLCTIHDEDISTYTNHKGKVQDYTYDELSFFNFGYHFKSLDDEYTYRSVSNNKLIPARIDNLFKQYDSSITYVLEIKEEHERGKQVAKLLYDLIIQYDLADHCIVASFDYDTMQYFQSINQANISCVMDYKHSKDFVVASYIGYDFLKTYSMDGIMFPLVEREIPLDDSYLIHKIHRHAMFAFYWTIDDEKTMKALIDKKVDGIITDRPDLLLKILYKEAGQMNVLNKNIMV